MSQSKRASLMEALINTGVGLLISLWLQMCIVPVITGNRASLQADCTVVFVFTLASVLRGYLLRRVFNLFSERAA